MQKALRHPEIKSTVIPAQARIFMKWCRRMEIPACAGMTQCFFLRHYEKLYFLRHCERSEAIHEQSENAGLLRYARNDINEIRAATNVELICAGVVLEQLKRQDSRA